MAWDMRMPLGCLDYNGNLSCAMRAPIVGTGSRPVYAAAVTIPYRRPGRLARSPGQEVEGERRAHGAADQDRARLAAVRGQLRLPGRRPGGRPGRRAALTLAVLAEGALGALLYLGFALI